MIERAPETEQLEHWRGAFGDAYTDRNAPTPELIRPRMLMWARILQSLAGEPPGSILEVGANIGLNLRALGALTPATLYALEPNARARERLVADRVVPAERVLEGVGSSIPLDRDQVDLAFTSGVLIHLGPSELAATCAEIHRVARRHILCVEYFADRPEEVPYRGLRNVLFKRDFGDFWMTQFPNLRPLDCGFFWRRTTGLDNLTWWLFAKP